MPTFICKNCEKKLELEKRIYHKAYKGHDYCLDCRSPHGGQREGAGRPSIGVTKKVSVTLPGDIWEVIEQGKGKQSMSAFLRELILENYQ